MLSPPPLGGATCDATCDNQWQEVKKREELMIKVVKYVLGFICFGLGVAVCIGTISAIGSGYAWIPAMFGAMLLLGAFFLLQRPNVESKGSWRPANVETSTTPTASMTERLASGFIKRINDDTNPNEVEASAYALAGLAGLLVGFAAAKVGASLEEYLGWCREGFEKSARESYQSHKRTISPSTRGRRAQESHSLVPAMIAPVPKKAASSKMKGN